MREGTCEPTRVVREQVRGRADSRLWPPLHGCSGIACFRELASEIGRDALPRIQVGGAEYAALGRVPSQPRVLGSLECYCARCTRTSWRGALGSMQPHTSVSQFEEPLRTRW